MTDARGRSDLPTAFEMLESVLLMITGAVVTAPMLPGFTLCVPGLILLAVVVLTPVAAAAALVTLAAAILAIPYLLVRSIGSIRSRRAAPTRRAGEAAGRRNARLRWRHASG
jgi:hypothetical protein